MFDIGMGEFLGLAVVALLVLGPDKLPKFAADAARFIHQVRKMANTAREDVRRELGPELQGISLEDLNPRTALRKHVLDGLDLDSGIDDDDDRPARTRKTTEPAQGPVPPPYDPDTT
ncbi:MAG: sec-independent translocase [Sporichthyaceae bacterium]